MDAACYGQYAGLKQNLPSVKIPEASCSSSFPGRNWALFNTALSIPWRLGSFTLLRFPLFPNFRLRLFFLILNLYRCFGFLFWIRAFLWLLLLRQTVWEWLFEFMATLSWLLTALGCSIDVRTISKSSLSSQPSHIFTTFARWLLVTKRIIRCSWRGYFACILTTGWMGALSVVRVSTCHALLMPLG